VRGHVDVRHDHVDVEEFQDVERVGGVGCDDGLRSMRSEELRRGAADVRLVVDDQNV